MEQRLSVGVIHCIYQNKPLQLCKNIAKQLPSAQTLGNQSGPSWALLMNTVSIRPAQCVMPPPSLAIELPQLQFLAAQAASAQQLLLCEILIEIRIQPAACLAAAKQRTFGFP